MISSRFLSDIKEKAFCYSGARGVFYSYSAVRAEIAYLSRFYLHALTTCCRAKRLLDPVAENGHVNRIYNALYQNYVLDGGRLRTIANSLVIHDFLKSEESRAIRSQWFNYDERHIASLKYPRSDDYPQRQGNLLLLKRYNPKSGEKGVIYLRFNESFKQFISLFDVGKIAGDYRLVLEPSTWGYMDESFHLFIGGNLDVVVQTQDEIDYNVVSSMNSNLRPIRMGAGDWVDSDTFSDTGTKEKTYDVIMIASWSSMKRHCVLFRALAENRSLGMRAALIGYPWDGRTKRDIQDEAKQFGVLPQLHIFENIPHSEVADILGRSKVSVMLSKREGANRALYESLLAGVPVVLYKHNRGVNRNIITSETGRFADDRELGAVLREMIKDSFKYQNVSSWARENIGRRIAHTKLNSMLATLAAQNKEVYSEPICEFKAGNMAYVSESDRLRMEDEYSRLATYIRR